MRKTAQRINDGAALRQAMAEFNDGEGIGLQALSLRTGKRVSTALLGFLTQPADQSRHARQTTSPESAGLIEDALGKPRGSLFQVVEVASRLS